MFNNLRPYLILSTAILFWGTSFIGAKIALECFSPISYISVRFCLASIIFFILLLIKGFPKLSKKEHHQLLILALFEPTLYFIFETIGINNSTATTSSLIIATIPIFVMVISYFMLKESITPMKFFGIILSFIGIYVVVQGDSNLGVAAGISYKGVISLLLAVLCAAFYNVISRNLSKKIPPFTITTFQILYGTLFMIPLFLFDLPNFHINEITTKAIITILYLTITSNVIAFLAYNYALSKIPASQTAVFLNGVPLVTVIGASLILGERLTLIQGIGGIIVIIALLITNNSTLLTNLIKQNQQKRRETSHANR